MLHTDPLSNRAVSAFPLSIGTSLCFESLFVGPNKPYDPEREIPQKVNINDYDEFYINISTLFRNINGALSKDEIYKVGVKGFKECLEFEIETIESIIKNEGNDRVKVIFYVCEYKAASNKLKYPYAQFRSDNTEKQLTYRKLHNDTIAKLLSDNKGKENLKVFDSIITPTHKCKALLMTHMAYDLLSHKNFSKFDLIESHTGVLKPKHFWYTKFHDGKTLNMIPFNKGFLQIFGDSEFFKPLDIRLRRTIVELAKENKWTQTITKDKIFMNLDTMKDHYSREIIKSILRS